MMAKKTNALQRTFSAPALPLIALCFAAVAALKTGEVIAALGTEKPATETHAGTDSPGQESPLMSPSGNMAPEGGMTAEEDHATPAPDSAPEMSPEMSPAASHGAGPVMDRPLNETQTGTKGEVCLSDKLMAAINERSAGLDDQRMQLASRTRALEVVEKRVAEEIARLEKNRKSLERILADARNESSEDMIRLVQIYASMKPKQAAVIFDEMAPQVAAAFIRRMRGNAAAFILANMDSKKAYAITLLIAGAEAPFQQN